MKKKTAKAPERRVFIDQIRDKIASICPGAREATLEAVDNWSAGKVPQHPYEAGVFSVCDQIAADIDATP